MLTTLASRHPLPQGERARKKNMPHPNDPKLRSFIPVDPTSDFPIQNLPYGVFSAKDGLAPRIGVAIGDYVLDVWQLAQDCRIDVVEPAVFAAPTLNPFMALGPNVWSRTRARLSELLRHDHPELPSFGLCKRLDFELEMGVVVGQPSAMGEMLTEQRAEQMIFGFVILNDWSARDIQQWEYVPLGPFQAKAFATSISPWIVTREALQPFRLHGPAQDPVPLPYLRQAGANNYDLQLDVGLRAMQTGEAVRIC